MITPYDGNKALFMKLSVAFRMVIMIDVMDFIARRLSELSSFCTCRDNVKVNDENTIYQIGTTVSALIMWGEEID